ncbi:MAG: family 10 glycosylhydrolase [Candidatus Aegiribacteria sp.]|nr:family 10 glycosylhydrolase [Candidatus Aegiribacteria sp.]
MKTGLPVLLAVMLIFAGSVQGTAPSCSSRYFWVVRDGLTSPEAIDTLLENAAEAGANGLIVQVVGRAEAYYDSSILPLAAFQQDFDPLEYIISRARPRGMEVHAWVNAFLVWSAPSPPSDSSHIWHSNPDWFIADKYGRSSRYYSRTECEENGLVGATLSPAVPEVREFIADIAVEIATEYNVDGIHLDYIRYPNPSFGFESSSVEAFYFTTGRDPLDLFRRNSGSEELSELWSQWKINQVTITVETVRSALRSESPETLLSCAVMADPFEAASHYSCDWRYWLSAGLVDFVCTMVYTTNASKARELAILGTGICPSRVVHGIGIYNQSIPSALIGAQEALERGCSGICVFSLNSLSSDSTWMLRNFWGRTGHPEYPIDSAVFHRVSNDGGVEL